MKYLLFIHSKIINFLTTSIVSKIQEIVFQFVLRHNCGNIVIYIVLIHIGAYNDNPTLQKKVFQLTKSI